MNFLLIYIIKHFNDLHKFRGIISPNHLEHEESDTEWIWKASEWLVGTYWIFSLKNQNKNMSMEFEYIFCTARKLREPRKWLNL